MFVAKGFSRCHFVAQICANSGDPLSLIVGTTNTTNIYNYILTFTVRKTNTLTGFTGLQYGLIFYSMCNPARAALLFEVETHVRQNTHALGHTSLLLQLP